MTRGIRQSEKPFFDLVSCPCFVLDGQGHFLEVNGAAPSVLGFEEPELVGRDVVDFVHPEERAAVKALLDADHRGYGVRTLDLRMRTRVGGHRWFRWTASWLGTPKLFVASQEAGRGLAEFAWHSHINDPLRLLVESVTDHGIFLLDGQGYVTSWNTGAQRLQGYDASDVLGESFAGFYTPEDRNAGVPEAELREAERAGRAESEGWRVRKDGTRFWATSVVTAVRDPGGKLLAYGVLLRDLTERKLADEHLRASEERLRLLVDAAQEYAIFMLDPVGRVLSWNAGAERIKGYTPAEIIGQHFSKFYTPEDVETRKPARALAEALETGRFTDEGWRLRKDGARFWASVVISRLITSSGELIGFGKVTRDLTARRKADEELRRSEERFRVLVDTVQDYAIFMLDPEGRVQSWNRGAQALKEYSAAEIIGQHFSKFYPPEDVASRKPTRELEAAMRDGRVEDEGWRLRKDGTRFWANVVITRLTDDHGKVLGFAKVTRDLTQRRAMEEAQREANVLLERRVAERTAELRAAEQKRHELELRLLESAKMEAIGRLAGGVAHDFNNMLTVIKGNVELLREGGDGVAVETRRDALAEVADAAERSAELTRQLLAFSRRQILIPRVLDVNEIVQGMLPMLNRLIGENIRVTTALAPDLLRTNADPSQIEQVILNLVVNARDAMPEGGDLAVETLNVKLDEVYAARRPEVRPGSYVMLAISDTGIGMDEATRARVFEPFFTTKGAGKGTGLGLATVHGVVRQSGGHVHVYSEQGHGSTFKVYLPATALAPEHVRGSAEEPCAVARPGARILLVEDEAAVRRLARAILTGMGHAVTEADDGEHALAVVARSRVQIDILVTDVVMPGMSGVQLYQQLREIYPELRVLYMSGYTENAVVHQGVLDPDVHFLQKPFTRDALCGKVRHVLDADRKPTSTDR